jgi:hypothetical protein
MPCKMLTRMTADGDELEPLDRRKTTKKGAAFQLPLRYSGGADRSRTDDLLNAIYVQDPSSCLSIVINLRISLLFSLHEGRPPPIFKSVIVYLHYTKTIQ